MKPNDQFNYKNVNENRNSYVGKLICFALFIVLGVGIFYIIFSANIGQTTTLIIGIILTAISFFLLSFILSTYNRLVSYSNKVSESLALIDIQLKLRFDLIPNLVSTVKGYAKHEKDIFKELSELRSLAYEAQNQKQKIAYANNMVPKIRQLVAISESYPELKSDALYKSLMSELVVVEDKIVAARRIYDSNVNVFNTEIMTFPSNLIAKLFDFNKVELFKIDAGERLTPLVKL